LSRAVKNILSVVDLADPTNLRCAATNTLDLTFSKRRRKKEEDRSVRREKKRKGKERLSLL